MSSPIGGVEEEDLAEGRDEGAYRDDGKETHGGNEATQPGPGNREACAYEQLNVSEGVLP